MLACHSLDFAALGASSPCISRVSIFHRHESPFNPTPKFQSPPPLVSSLSSSPPPSPSSSPSSSPSIPPPLPKKKKHKVKPNPTYLRNQHSIPSLNPTSDPVPILIQSAGAHSQHLRLIQLLDGRLGQEDARGGLGLGFYALHQHPVEQGGERLDRFEGGGLGGVLEEMLRRMGRRKIGGWGEEGGRCTGLERGCIQLRC